MPRTGSTTFQHILARSRSELNEAGILYPDLTPASVRDKRHLSHQHFGETLDGRRPRLEREELLRSLSDSIARSDCDVILLSYEDFIRQQRRFRVPELLNEFFASRGYQTEALVTVKPQSENLNSMYTLRTQMIRERQDFEHFTRIHMEAARFEYDKLIGPWSAALSGRIRAVPVRDHRRKAPLLLRLLTELGLYRRVAPMLRPGDMHRIENRSPGPVAVEISRRLRATRTHARLRVPPREMMRVVQRLAWEGGYDRQKFNGVGPELHTELDTRYRDINERFASHLWKQGWDDVVAPEPVCPVNELIAGRIDPRTEADIREILNQASQQFAITPRHSLLDDPLNRIAESFEALQRRLGILRWRVV
jgi:hypothetical protein